MSLVAVVAAACSAPEQTPAAPKAPGSARGSSSAPVTTSAGPPPATSSAPPAPASSSARPKLPTRVEPLAETSELAKLVAPLFRKGAKGRYAHHHEVDTHGTEKDSILRTDREAECVVADVVPIGPALVARVVCTTLVENGRKLPKPAPSDEGSSPLPAAFVLMGGSLWASDVVPTTEDAVAELAATTPLLQHPLAPAPVGETPQRDPKTGDLPTACAHGATREKVEVRGKQIEGWCATTACAAMYGPGVDTTCFAPGLGVVRRDLTNRAGPTLERVRWKG